MPIILKNVHFIQNVLRYIFLIKNMILHLLYLLFLYCFTNFIIGFD